MEILKHIEELRDELNTLVNDIENCDKDKLLKVSQELDKAILKYINAMDAKVMVQQSE